MNGIQKGKDAQDDHRCPSDGWPYGAHRRLRGTKRDQVTGKGTLAISNTIDMNVRSDADGSNPRDISPWETRHRTGLNFNASPLPWW